MNINFLVDTYLTDQFSEKDETDQHASLNEHASLNDMNVEHIPDFPSSKRYGPDKKYLPPDFRFGDLVPDIRKMILPQLPQIKLNSNEKVSSSSLEGSTTKPVLEIPENFFTNSADFELVIIESPYSGDLEGNLDYLDCAMLDCKQRGEGGIASHLLYTKTPFYGHVHDGIPDGFSAGRIWCMNLVIKGWSKIASKAVFYVDRGMSSGMKLALEYYEENNIPVVFRRFNLSLEQMKHQIVIEKKPLPLAFRTYLS